MWVRYSTGVLECTPDSTNRISWLNTYGLVLQVEIERRIAWNEGGAYVLFITRRSWSTCERVIYIYVRIT